jgi:hypothetical protein
MLIKDVGMIISGFAANDDCHEKLKLYWYTSKRLSKDEQINQYFDMLASHHNGAAQLTPFCLSHVLYC